MPKKKEKSRNQKNYKNSIELNPKDADSYFMHGNVQSKLGFYEEAIKNFDHAIEIDPK